MTRNIAMILLTLAVMAAIQSRVETRLGLHAGTTAMSFELRTGLRS